MLPAKRIIVITKRTIETAAQIIPAIAKPLFFLFEREIMPNTIERIAGRTLTNEQKQRREIMPSTIEAIPNPLDGSC